METPSTSPAEIADADAKPPTATESTPQATTSTTEATSVYSLIISDLHLCPQRLETCKLFFRFLRDEATKAEALYIIGDFIEYWVGDDDLTPFHQAIITRLKAYTDSGRKLYFMHGNRDFLLGRRFMEQTGGTLLPDPSILNFYGKNILVMHGDLLCTQDNAYMRYRRIVHKKWLQWLFLRFPLKWRRKLALTLRKMSQKRYARYKGAAPFFDVSSHAVELAFEKSQCPTLIHGHTHRIDIHQHGENQRVVLGDWHQQGSFVRLSADEIVLCDFV